MRSLATTILAVIALVACSTGIEAQTMDPKKLPPRLQKLFEKTKPVCFGRFLIDVPGEAIVVPGPQAFGPDIETIENGAKSIRKMVENKKLELTEKKFRDRSTPYLRDVTNGPTPDAWTLLWWDGSAGKKVGMDEFTVFFRSKEHAYSFHTATAPSEGRTFESESADIGYIVDHLRARAPDEMPVEPGVCLDLGFIADDAGKFQEIFGVGFRFPSLPDVSLSISSNKNGQTDPPLSEKRKEAERAVMGTPLEAEFRKVKVLREGRHKIYQWNGEEALFRRPREEGGVWHEFQYEYPGIRYDKDNPSWDAAMFTGVDRNTAGGEPSGLSDEEAIALWDAVMSTLRLRVPAR